jgi:hypothetical protein
MKKVLVICVAIVLMFSLVLGACAKPAPSLPANIDIATHPTGSITSVVATGWSAILTKNTPMTIVAKPMTGPGVFLPRVNAGEVDIGVDVSNGLSRAWRGDAEWQGKAQKNLRTLWQVMVLNNVPPIVVRKDSKFFKVEDLKGARVASDYGGNVNVVLYFTVAAAGVGMTWDDVIKVPVTSLHEGWVALREGRVDASFGQSLTVPDARETNAAIGIRWIGYPRNPEEIPEFKKLFPGMKGMLLKPRPGGILDREIWGQNLPFYYVASTHMSEETAYQLVKTAWEHDTEIQPIHPALKRWTHDLMLGEPVAPFHEGAIRLYKEKGIWTKEMEQKQKELLK